VTSRSEAILIPGVGSIVAILGERDFLSRLHVIVSRSTIWHALSWSMSALSYRERHSFLNATTTT
jgi:hypothetical protein